MAVSENQLKKMVSKVRPRRARCRGVPAAPFQPPGPEHTQPPASLVSWAGGTLCRLRPPGRPHPEHRVAHCGNPPEGTWERRGSDRLQRRPAEPPAAAPPLSGVLGAL